MKHLGDICKIDGSKIPPVDIITFGSPCQDLSVAGRREGLAGARSGLFMEAVRVIKEMRNATTELSMRGADGHIQPSVAVWENVPGAFSSNHGDDFRCVLEELARIKDPEVSIPMPVGGGDLQDISEVMASLSHGEPTMRNFGEYPKDAKESRLSLILETNPDPKYNLSPKACQGILRRANNRGKKLPELLERTLIQQSVCKETELIEAMNQDQRPWLEKGGSYTLNATDRHAICNQLPRESRESGGVRESLSKTSESELCLQAQTSTSATHAVSIGGGKYTMQ